MKKIISKIALVALVISSMPVHAGFGQPMHNGARSLLQNMRSSQSLQIALAVGSLTAMAVLLQAHNTYRKSEDRTMKSTMLWDAPLAALLLSGITATFAWGLAKTFGLK